MVHLITGYAGYEHIKSEDAGSFNAAFFGNGQFVMEVGSMFEASIIDNNTVRVLDGDGLMYGRHFRVNPNTYEDLIITTGTAGLNRIDLICIVYEKNENDGTEQAYLQVVKGTEMGGATNIPEYTNGNILEGAVLNQMPLYKVTIEGVVLKNVEALFETIPTYKTLAEKYAKQFKEDCDTHLNSLNVLDTMEEIEANTQEKQLAGALALKEVGEKLIASDGTEFRFGVNEDGEYGYIVTKDGADSVIPFKRAQGNAKPEQVLNPYTFINEEGVLYTGSMTDNGAKKASLNCGDSYTIPAGYHNGSGKVAANSLASQTSATATASDILSGETAWVNGVKLTGTYDKYRKYVTYRTCSINNTDASIDICIYNEVLWKNQYFGNIDDGGTIDILGLASLTYNGAFFEWILTFLQDVTVNGTNYNSGSSITWKYSDEKEFEVTPR